MDDKTYIDITRPWYTKAIPFPLSLFLPARRQKRAEVRVQLTKGGDHITDAETESKVSQEGFLKTKPFYILVMCIVTFS